MDITFAKELFDIGLRRAGLSQSTARPIYLGSEIKNTPFVSVVVDLSQIPSTDLVVRFKDNNLLNSSKNLGERVFERYDFLKEWNNFGYGKISVVADDLFGICGVILKDPSSVIAEVFQISSGKKVSDYAAVFQQSGKTVFWCARHCGPIDGFDWALIEDFFTTNKIGDASEQPLVSEIPFGFKGAFTMRIDCDEAIASGRPLFELYQKNNLPFSMAIKTQQNIGSEDIELMSEVIDCGGSVVTHSHTHAPNWGGSEVAAYNEIMESRKVFESLGIRGLNTDYVVSPFHQNPSYAVRGLAKAGIKGFVSGIIANDPEYLVSRAGLVPGSGGMITHSQQCMLHGDTFRDQGESILSYQEAFQQALKTNTFFGYLDHPFSSYKYGWADERQRLDVHQRFINYIKEHSRIWSPNLVDALKFLRKKSLVKVADLGAFYRLECTGSVDEFADLPSLKVIFKDQEFELKLGQVIELKK